MNSLSLLCVHIKLVEGKSVVVIVGLNLLENISINKTNNTVNWNNLAEKPRRSVATVLKSDFAPTDNNHGTNGLPAVTLQDSTTKSPIVCTHGRRLWACLCRLPN